MIWLIVIIALAAIGVCMAFAGTRASRPRRKPSRLSRVLAEHDRNEARLRAEQQERGDKGAA